MLIDELIAKITLKSTGFKKDSREAQENLDKTSDKAKKAEKSITHMSEKGIKGVSGLTKSILALAGVSFTASAAKNFISSMTDSFVDMGNVASTLDMPTRELDGFYRAAESIGSTKGGIEGVLRALRGASDSFENPMYRETLAPAYKMMQKLTNESGMVIRTNKGIKQTILDIAKAIRKVRPSSQREFATAFGLDDATLQAIRRGDFEKNIEKYTNNSYYNTKAYKDALKFKAQVEEMKQNLNNIGIQSMDVAFPYLESASKSITKMLDEIQKNPEMIKRFINTGLQSAKELAEALETIVSTLKGMGKAVDAVKDGWDFLKNGKRDDYYYSGGKVYTKEEEAKKTGKPVEKMRLTALGRLALKHYGSPEKAYEGVKKELTDGGNSPVSPEDADNAIREKYGLTKPDKTTNNTSNETSNTNNIHVSKLEIRSDAKSFPDLMKDIQNNVITGPTSRLSGVS